MFTLICAYCAVTTKDGDWILGGLICLIIEACVYKAIFT